MRRTQGQPAPLGATWEGTGVNFALYSENATAVELCLFDRVDAKNESARIPLPHCTRNVWHIFIEDIQPGTLYGYRVHGPFEPQNGHWFNPNKILADPYARQIERPESHDRAMFENPNDLTMDVQDNAALAPLSQVINPEFAWEGDRRPNTPWNKTVIYETHVKGLTARHPKVPQPLRGTYRGLTAPPVLEHLKSLGVTAVELLPIHQHYSEQHLFEKDLSNYWGYNTLAYFAPDQRFNSGTLGTAVDEFKTMVRALHVEGIEVILDVVYNHSAEGDRWGPTLSLRGIDNTTYYRLKKDSKGSYADSTGCGNSLNASHPTVSQLILDSLRYWVTEMHVDGFRFDLAPTLARKGNVIDFESAFFKTIEQDPILSQVKMIAEPWDLGKDGYQLGNFPGLWKELNGKYRDAMRRYWRGDEKMVPEMARRLTASSDLYQTAKRPPQASVNFITSHDGFTLQDLVSHNRKHNEDNQESNGDGSDGNHSWNCGIEGATENSSIKSLRARQKRNLLATLLLSQGVPFLCGGDELSRSQSGNNNAYCQDNEISHYRWDLSEEEQQFLEFTRQLIRFRKSHPTLQRKTFFHGEEVDELNSRDIHWFAPNGQEKTQAEWHTPFARCFGCLMNGEAIEDLDAEGNRVVGDTLLLLMNAHHERISFILPTPPRSKRWAPVMDTHLDDSFSPGPLENPFPLAGSSLAVFILQADEAHRK
jgi:glycogen operon protein